MAVATASVYLSHGTDVVSPERESRTTAAPVVASARETKDPELVKSCEDAPDEKRCEKEEATYERCAASGFAGRRCRDSDALHRDQQAFLADCSRADVIRPLPHTCAEGAEPVGEAYRYCRFLGRSALRCDRSARYAACLYRGGGKICADAAPVYRACQTRSVAGAKIARRFCIEGDIQYQRCRHAHSIGSGSDMCRPVTAAYIDCRPAAEVEACEKARDDYAKAHYPRR
ncbi:hypothetical protein [Nonomuraea sp. NPDC049625]|uniref:hypothetical protein n=1 Tax=Nonomuraea sp. NPDC049625 TaxID=3155775 RepID=UPI003439E07D